MTTMKYMYDGATVFNQPLNDWDVSGVTDMSFMFKGAKRFNQPLDTWVTRQVTSTRSMFQSAESFNQPLGSWDISNVNNMTRMFYHATSFQQDLCNWYNLEYQQVPFVSGMFVDTNCSNESDPDFDNRLSFCGTSEQHNCPKQVCFNALFHLRVYDHER